MTFHEFKEKAEKSGKFFHSSNMRWWKTRVAESSWIVFNRFGYFVTSDVIGGVRRYTIRRGNLETGSVRAASQLGAFVTLAQAKYQMTNVIAADIMGPQQQEAN